MPEKREKKPKAPSRRQRLKHLDQARNYVFQAMWQCHDAGEAKLSGYLSKLADMILEAHHKASKETVKKPTGGKR